MRISRALVYVLAKLDTDKEFGREIPLPAQLVFQEAHNIKVLSEHTVAR
jgi:hypothetical protein